MPLPLPKIDGDDWEVAPRKSTAAEAPKIALDLDEAEPRAHANGASSVAARDTTKVEKQPSRSSRPLLQTMDDDFDKSDDDMELPLAASAAGMLRARSQDNIAGGARDDDDDLLLSSTTPNTSNDNTTPEMPAAKDDVSFEPAPLASGDAPGSPNWATVHSGGVEVAAEGYVRTVPAGETTAAGDPPATANGPQNDGEEEDYESDGSERAYSESQLRRAVSEAVSRVEQRAAARQERAVEGAIEAAAEQLRQELAIQAEELESEHEKRLRVALIELAREMEAKQKQQAIRERARKEEEAAAGASSGGGGADGAATSLSSAQKHEGAAAATGGGTAGPENAASATVDADDPYLSQLSEVLRKQQHCAVTFRSISMLLGNLQPALQPKVREALSELEEATAIVSTLKEEWSSRPKPAPAAPTDQDVEAESAEPSSNDWAAAGLDPAPAGDNEEEHEL